LSEVGPRNPSIRPSGGNAKRETIVPPAGYNARYRRPTELHAVIELLSDILRRREAGEPLALCTVVRTRGSTPQKAGAMLVVLADGRTLGTIGGGCVEAEVRTRALRLLAVEASNPAPDDQLFSFKLDHDLGWDDGLVCGGSMDVAVQRLADDAAVQSIRNAVQRLRQGEPAELAVSAATPEGVQTFVRVLQPVPRLFIAGAGHVGEALAAIAAPAGFDITVFDDRADLASAGRFPTAARVVGDIADALRAAKIDRRTFVVIVTRGHRHDADALAAVVRSDAAYIGLIGSRRKIVHIYRELADGGLPPELLARVHAPIGLDLGAVSPGEIAVSIAAELIAVRYGRGDAVRSLRLADSLLRQVTGRP
jgi:xanthine dehydrogenase accessory factor